MKPMLPQLQVDPPIGEDWVYETKFDGFRAILFLEDSDKIKLISRNGKNLLPQFPELNKYIQDLFEKFRPFLPCILDGELCILINSFKANFSAIQKRGRLRSKEKIVHFSHQQPCKYLVFDLLKISDENVTNKPFYERKTLLLSMFKTLQLPINVDYTHPALLQMVPYEKDFSQLWKQVEKFDGEGIVSKHLQGKWIEGKRSSQWIKVKNWKKALCFITAYDRKNGYFHVGVFRDNNITPIGLFKHGVNDEERKALLEVVKNNYQHEDNQILYVPPGICVELNYLELYEGQLREVFFSKFRFDLKPIDCTWEKITESTIDLPKSIDITHPDKPLWQHKKISKMDYISYLRFIYPYMEPFLHNRLLTVIRYPHGMYGEAFFQKNCPEYAPDFVRTFEEDGIRYIVCDCLETFLWLGNQLAIEFHIPFTTIQRKTPSEIVIDLDPPTRKDFAKAIEAANMIHEILLSLGIKDFIKVSGNRGLQIYIPLPIHSTITWEDSRLFTYFIASYLISKNENAFTIERLKKNRGNRLYIDYIQHAEGKTIISPYSVRGNENAGVAAPIHWEELNQPIQPDGFSMEKVMERIKLKGCPFSEFFNTDNEQPIQQVINFLKKKR